MDQFGPSVNQPYTDLNCYIGFALGNIANVNCALSYVHGSRFMPKFLEPDAGRNLAQMRSLTDGILGREVSWIANLPQYAAAPTPVRGVKRVKLRSVVSAIRRSELIRHQSLSSPEPRWRCIAPHAIGFYGFRWHTRAFCLNDECFMDFLYSRIIEVRGSRERETSADDDSDWHSPVTIKVGPHLELSETHAKVIALDYGMRGGKAKIKVRLALLYAKAARARYRHGGASTTGSLSHHSNGSSSTRAPRAATAAILRS